MKGVESVDGSKSNESVVKNKGASATHSDIDDIAHSVDIEPAQDACSIVNDSKASKDFSSSTYLGDIEIVEDDDDDEEEPWPFTASPLSSTENEFVEKTDVSSVLENSNLNTDNVSVLSVSKSMKTVLTANEIESGELHVINSAQDDLQYTDKAVERTPFEKSLLHQNASETSLQKYKHSALAMAPPAKSATGSSSNSTLKSVSKGSKSPWHDPPVSVSPKKVDGDLYQPARMQSRMAEPNLNESITESMWKDMFNSEVVPLDFNEMPAVRKSPKKQQKLLAVYKSSVARVSQCSRERDTCVSVSNYINTPSGDSYPVTDAPRIEPLTTRFPD
ncbi:hypothetical protein EB796_015712 [Bugula neritina]|uniref:Uncharacterized protein n=1 Tax=Bugula neritina TaxID=10212 RepID=A0A7J7JJK0_BUGNE|nr:hypothetical protein EB796_015712 [Bugula neritina]